jgi:uncharacterized protein
MRLYNPLSAYWKEKFGIRIWKIPLDAGFKCPNRDGSISSRGCIFCNEQGSGTGLNLKSISIKDQYNLFRKKLISRHGRIRFAAYLQSFTNTYCPPDRLASVLDQLKGLEDLAVLCVGTRPDCLDEEKLNILASFPCEEVWLDLGLQSSCDDTLKRINRGHFAADFSVSCRMGDSKKINICAHVIAGLPGEDMDRFLKTIDFINNEPVRGVKIHNLYVCADTALAMLWKKKEYTPLKLEENALWLAQALARLRPDIIIHRLTGDPAPGELVAPEWAGEKNRILNQIKKIMAEKNLWQGKEWKNIQGLEKP